MIFDFANPSVHDANRYPDVASELLVDHPRQASGFSDYEVQWITQEVGWWHDSPAWKDMIWLAIRNNRLVGVADEVWRGGTWLQEREYVRVHGQCRPGCSEAELNSKTYFLPQRYEVAHCRWTRQPCARAQGGICYIASLVSIINKGIS